MKLFSEMNTDPKTAIITGRNQVSSELQSAGGLDLGNGATAVPFDEGTKKSPAVETIKKQRETVNKQSGAALDLGEGVELVPFD